MKIIILNEVFLFPTLSLIFFCLSSIYIYFFKRIIGKKIVPTGAGILLPFFLVISLENFNQQNHLFLSIIVIFINALFYFIDDIRTLKPFVRIFIALLTGLLLVFVNKENLLISNLSNYILLIYFSIILLTCLLVNVLNFYDGSDLNLCIIIFLSGIILLFSNNYPILYSQYLGSVMISFALGFGALNSRPKIIYLGDSGSFSIAALIVFIFISALTESNYIPIEFISLLALPI